MKVFETAKEKEVRKILFNVLAVDGELSTLERYNLGIESVAYLTRCLPNIRIAVVGKQPAMDGFGVRVGQNRGVAAETFSTQEQALKWLARWPS